MRTIIFFTLFVGFVIGQQAWDAYNYPNPIKGQFMECHVETLPSPVRICDPDQVLMENERQILNEKLLEIERSSAQVCKKHMK